jgi:hypothetical protein
MIVSPAGALCAAIMSVFICQTCHDTIKFSKVCLSRRLVLLAAWGRPLDLAEPRLSSSAGGSALENSVPFLLRADLCRLWREL